MGHNQCPVQHAKLTPRHHRRSCFVERLPLQVERLSEFAGIVEVEGVGRKDDLPL